MELEKLQQKGIDGIDFFKKKIEKDIEDFFVERYKDLGKKIHGLTESFLMELKELNNLVSNNQNKTYCKFYYIQKDNSLNLGICFSNSDQCVIKEKEDALYNLLGETISDKNFIKMKDDFKNGIGAELSPHTNKIQDILIFYTLEEIKYYINEMTKLFPTIYSLKFNMLQYRSTGIDNEILADFAEKNKRIAFCVHAQFNKTGNSYDESDGYNLGNLRP